VFDFTGAAEGIRTPDPRITNALLYRLSYRGFIAFFARRDGNCHPIATRNPVLLFSFRASPGEGRLHDLGSPSVGVLEHVAIDVKGDGRRGMPDPTRREKSPE
jgi:hypothetical protein